MRLTRPTVTAVLLLALTACGSSDNSGGDGGSPGGSGKKPATPTADTGADRDAKYLNATQDIAFTSHRPDDAELLAFPPQWCTGLDAGHSAAWLFSGGGGNLYPNGMGWGTVKKNANQLLVAGVRTYCPGHLDAVTEELRASGAY